MMTWTALFTIGGGALACWCVGYVMGGRAAYRRHREQMGAFRNQVHDLQTELHAAEKQIEAQNRIYQRLETRLTQQFGTPSPNHNPNEPPIIHRAALPMPHIRRTGRVRHDGLLTFVE